MSRRLAMLAFIVPALALFLAAAWTVLGGRKSGGNAPGTISQGGVLLKSTTIALPADEPAFPGGAASDVLTNNCTACHSAEMILMQPPLEAKTWNAEVTKMRTVFHAAVDEKDQPAIVAALLALPSQRPPATMPQPAKGAARRRR